MTIGYIYKVKFHLLKNFIIMKTQREFVTLIVTSLTRLTVDGGASLTPSHTRKVFDHFHYIMCNLLLIIHYNYYILLHIYIQIQSFVL